MIDIYVNVRVRAIDKRPRGQLAAPSMALPPSIARASFDVLASCELAKSSRLDVWISVWRYVRFGCVTLAATELEPRGERALLRERAVRLLASRRSALCTVEHWR